MEWQLDEYEREQYERDIQAYGDLWECIYFDVAKGMQRRFFFKAKHHPEERARRILAEKGITNYIRMEVRETDA